MGALKAAELKKRADEAEVVEKIVKEMEHERKEMEAKKIKTRQQMRKVFLENAEDERVKEALLREQKEKDAIELQEFNRLLDKNEEERAAELEARLAKQKDLMEKMKADMAKKDQQSGDEDAMRARKQQEEADARYDEMETKKQARLKR